MKKCCPVGRGSHPDTAMTGRAIALRWPRPRRAGGTDTLRLPVAPLYAARTAQRAVPIVQAIAVSSCAPGRASSRAVVESSGGIANKEIARRTAGCGAGKGRGKRTPRRFWRARRPEPAWSAELPLGAFERVGRAERVLGAPVRGWEVAVPSERRGREECSRGGCPMAVWGGCRGRHLCQTTTVQHSVTTMQGRRSRPASLVFFSSTLLVGKISYQFSATPRRIYVGRSRSCPWWIVGSISLNRPFETISSASCPWFELDRPFRPRPVRVARNAADASSAGRSEIVPVAGLPTNVDSAAGGAITVCGSAGAAWNPAFPEDLAASSVTLKPSLNSSSIAAPRMMFAPSQWRLI